MDNYDAAEAANERTWINGPEIEDEPEVSIEDKILMIVSDADKMRSFGEQLDDAIDPVKMIDLYECISGKGMAHAGNKRIFDLLKVIERCIENA